MFTYSISRKQAGVIFGAIKRGELVVDEKFINWLYNNIADAKCFSDNSHLVDIYGKMHNAVDAFFSGNKAECNDLCNKAFDLYNVFFA